MRIHDQAIAILEKTEDGSRLTPEDLKLVETAVNGWLTEAGEVAFAQLYAAVASGDYLVKPHWFHDVEHLTRDHEGYVYWKNRCVEHYSYDDKAREKAAAERLASRCRALEAKGLPVTGRTAISSVCAEAPDNRWVKPLTTYYCFFTKDGNTYALFHDGKGNTLYLGQDQGQLTVKAMPDPYTAFHELQNSGYAANNGPSTYEEFLACMNALGVTAEQMNNTL